MGVVAVSLDRKSTRLNSSHTIISYAVFCLKKKRRLYAELCHAAHTTPTPHQPQYLSAHHSHDSAFQPPTDCPCSPACIDCFFFFLRIGHPRTSPPFPYPSPFG